MLCYILDCFWLKTFNNFSRAAENGAQTIIYCATEQSVAELRGMYFSDCAVQLTSENGSNMEDAERLWEMSERMARYVMQKLWQDIFLSPVEKNCNFFKSKSHYRFHVCNL